MCPSPIFSGAKKNKFYKVHMSAVSFVTLNLRDPPVEIWELGTVSKCLVVLDFLSRLYFILVLCLILLINNIK